MSEFLGATISLISKSDIRYVGVLHEINSEESTVSLENVRSWGTEGRKGNPEEEIPASAQIYEYIVFRGSDVKDLRIEEGPAKEEKHPAAVPNDPAIVGARPRPPNGPTLVNQQVPAGPAGFAQNLWGGNNFFTPQMGGWGRGNMGPGPGSAYPPPPPHGFLPPGQFIPGPGVPGAPGPWGNNFSTFSPGPPAPLGGPGGPMAPGCQGQIQRPGSNAPVFEKKLPVIGINSDKRVATGPPSELPSEPKSLGQGPTSQAKAGPLTPPADTAKPSVDEVKSATIASMPSSRPTARATIVTGPSGPSADTAPKSVRPVVPTGPAVSKFTPPVSAMSSKPPAPPKQPIYNPEAALRDATEAAKAAVAVAMSKMQQESSSTPQNGAGSAMDNLTKKVNEMRLNAARGTSRTRTRGGRHPPGKVEVPDADFDFASSNAKFNKEEVLKEVKASPGTDATGGADGQDQVDAKTPAPAPAYDKKASFFDNISSEAKDRAENGGQKPGGREWRGEEQRRNIETFGSPSVDNGYRPNYRRGGRSRSGMGRRGFRGRGGGQIRNRENQGA